MPFAFLNPLLLSLAPLASLPIIIHLAQRKKFKILKWGAMEFLLLSEAKTTKKRKIQNLILLILRTLMVLIAILAGSRPLLKTSALAGLAGRQRTHAVLILDDSYSMSYSLAPPGAVGGSAVFDRAKEMAKQILSLLRPGDAVSVILASYPPRIVGNLSYQPQLVKHEVDQLKVSMKGTDYVGALALARDELKASTLPHKEVYIIGDCQAEGWKRGSEDTDPFKSLVEEKAVVFIVKTPIKDDANAAVVNVEFPKGLVDTIDPTRIVATVENHGDEDMRHVNVELVVDDVSSEKKSIFLKGKSKDTVDFKYHFDQTKTFGGYIQVSTDPLMADNRFYFHARPQDDVRVLCVDGGDGDSMLFFQLAMDPTGKGGIIRVTSIRAGELESHLGKLHEFHALALANMSTLTEKQVQKIEEFVKDGGGLLLATGELVDPKVYNHWFHRERAGCLPGKLVENVGDAKTKKTYSFISGIKANHNLLRIFPEDALSDLNQVKFYKYAKVQLDDNDPTAGPILSFKDGSPVLSERRFGKGRVLLWASSLDDVWNDLPMGKHLMYLPLMRQLVFYMSARPFEVITVGNPIIRQLSFREYPAQSEIPVIVNPLKETAKVAFTTMERGCEIRYEKTELPGSYILAKPGMQTVSAGIINRFSVNLDTTESDLKSFNEQNIQALFPSAKFRFFESLTGIEEVMRRERVGFELWKPLLYMLLALAALEFMLSHLFTHSQMARVSR